MMKDVLKTSALERRVLPSSKDLKPSSENDKNLINVSSVFDSQNGTTLASFLDECLEVKSYEEQHHFFFLTSDQSCFKSALSYLENKGKEKIPVFNIDKGDDQSITYKAFNGEWRPAIEMIPQSLGKNTITIAVTGVINNLISSKLLRPDLDLSSDIDRSRLVSIGQDFYHSLFKASQAQDIQGKKLNIIFHIDPAEFEMLREQGVKESNLVNIIDLLAGVGPQLSDHMSKSNHFVLLGKEIRVL